jgi:hypothetical protein
VALTIAALHYGAIIVAACACMACQSGAASTSGKASTQLTKRLHALTLMSAVTPIADKGGRVQIVSFVPEAAIRPKFVDPDQHGLIVAVVNSFNAERSMAA